MRPAAVAAVRPSARRVADEDVLAAIASDPRHQFVPDASDTMPTPTVRSRSGRARRFLRRTGRNYVRVLDLSPGRSGLEMARGCGTTLRCCGVSAQRTSSSSSRVIQSNSVSIADTFARLRQRFCSAGDGKQGWPEHAPYDRRI
ncbi:hypothetical protein C9J85_11480 [Haloferax sp. wsp5]|nr:hypothetical protein C9J85_11480 [Haloferax sp. wsp5]